MELIYDCIAVSNHYGSLAFGHYTAYAKNFETGHWYDYNDSSVSTIRGDPESEVVSSAAYVIYYVRRDFFPAKTVDFSQVKIRSLTSLPEEMAPPTVSPHPPQILAKQGTVLAQVEFPMGDTAPTFGGTGGMGGTGAENLEALDDSQEAAPPGYQHLSDEDGYKKDGESTESEPERDD